MMKKKVRIILLSSVMVSLIFFISLGIKTKAQDCSDCDPIPTSPGDANDCPMRESLKFDPTNPAQIEERNSIVIKVLDGSAPFIWEDPGNGYTWASGDVIDAEHPKRKRSNIRSNTLYSASGNCGSDFNAVGVVKVTDFCGDSISTAIRNIADGGTEWIDLGGGTAGSTILGGDLFYIDEFRFYIDAREHYNLSMGNPSCEAVAFPLLINYPGYFEFIANKGAGMASRTDTDNDEAFYLDVLATWVDQVNLAYGNPARCYKTSGTDGCALIHQNNPCQSGYSNPRVGYGYRWWKWGCK